MVVTHFPCYCTSMVQLYHEIAPYYNTIYCEITTDIQWAAIFLNWMEQIHQIWKLYSIKTQSMYKYHFHFLQKYLTTLQIFFWLAIINRSLFQIPRVGRCSSLYKSNSLNQQPSALLMKRKRTTAKTQNTMPCCWQSCHRVLFIHHHYHCCGYLQHPLCY